MVEPDELDDPVVVAVVVADEVVPVTVALVPVVVAVAVADDVVVTDEVVVTVDVVDAPPVVDAVAPVVVAPWVVFELVFEVGPLVLDSVAGSEEQAANETPRAHVVSKREALLIFLIVVGPEASV